MPFPRCKGNLYDWGSRVPLAVRWGGHIQPGRRLDDLVSLTDLAPTFLEAADIAVPKQMTGRSLLPLLAGKQPPAEEGTREFVVFGRERHTPAQAAPSLDGYPSRAMRTNRWLLILNLEPERWPAGVPNGATHPIGSFADCDDGPTKQWLVDHQDEVDYAKYFRLCFAQRPAVELYDCEADPDQVNNLAANLEHADTVKELRKQLATYLETTADPRFTDPPIKFDEFPYRAKYLQPTGVSATH
jgi:arylsulfatase A-like enzyme